MRTTPISQEKAYTTLAMVSSISFVIMAMLVFSIRGNIRNLDSQMRAQVKQDYAQKEDAILGALLHIVPNKAIGAMQGGSANDTSKFTWDAIFAEALASANAERSISTQLLNSLGLASAISGNTSDSNSINVTQLIQAPFTSPAGGSNRVNGGNIWESTMLGNALVGSRVPAALNMSYDVYLLDKKYPIISTSKTYTTSYTKGLGLSPTLYPLYNLIQYPDVKFGYKKPGEYFVAKRNWWVFSLNFGSDSEARTGIPSIQRDYVLSIYEIPSQVPLSASTLMKVGKFADGTAWQNVSLDGSIVADRLQTEGTVNVTNGAISARRELNLSAGTKVNGKSIQSNFDDLGEREVRGTGSKGSLNNPNDDSDFYEASVGGNIGKVAFIPINRGTDTLLNTSDGNRNARISPTGWNEYSQAAPKAKITVEILAMSSSTNQMPTRIRVTYTKTNGTTATATYKRGTSTWNTTWPTDLQTGGTSFPFQSDQLDNSRKALIVYLDRLPAFVNSLSGSGGIANNNSLYIYPTTGVSTVTAPSIPAANTDMVVSLRGGSDLTSYNSGFSIVSRYRVYIADTLNNVPMTPPANAGLPAGYTFYPPFSIFAPEKRFGESLSTVQPVVMRGQLNSLKTGSNETVNPLELKDGTDFRIDAGKIDAELMTLRSPAELPPIYMMNWLVTVEAIR